MNSVYKTGVDYTQKNKKMESYLNKSGNSPITHYEIGSDCLTIRFKGGKDYTYSKGGKAGNPTLIQ